MEEELAWTMACMDYFVGRNHISRLSTLPTSFCARPTWQWTVPKLYIWQSLKLSELFMDPSKFPVLLATKKKTQSDFRHGKLGSATAQVRKKQLSPNSADRYGFSLCATHDRRLSFDDRIEERRETNPGTFDLALTLASSLSSLLSGSSWLILTLLCQKSSVTRWLVRRKPYFLFLNI